MNLQLILFVAGVTWICLLGLLHMAYIVLHYPLTQWGTHLFRSESYPVDSEFDAVLKEATRRWRNWRRGPPLHYRSPRRQYRLIQRIGVGDLCDVYLASSHSKKFVIKIPRTPQGEHLLRTEMERLGQMRTSSRGSSYQRYLPAPVERFPIPDRHLSVFEYHAGLRTAVDFRSLFPNGLPDHHLAWMFNRTLEILGFIHEQGFVHGAILPPHLLLHAETHGAQLIGWTHSVRMHEPITIVSMDYQHWYPSECVRREPATSATDIYLAAKTMLWLSGGDVDSHRYPSTMATEIQNVLSRCLAPVQSHRPQEAWKLHQEFGGLLKDLFGQPKFQPLWVA